MHTEILAFVYKCRNFTCTFFPLYEGVCSCLKIFRDNKFNPHQVAGRDFEGRNQSEIWRPLAPCWKLGWFSFFNLKIRMIRNQNIRVMLSTNCESKAIFDNFRQLVTIKTKINGKINFKTILRNFVRLR